MLGAYRGERDDRSDPVELEWRGGTGGSARWREAAHDYLLDQMMEADGWLIAI